MSLQYETKFGSLKNFEKGRVEPIADDAKHYAFSNCFDIANKSKPYEKVVFGKIKFMCLRFLGQKVLHLGSHVRTMSLH